MGKLSTHVLDTTQGKPGAGVRIELFAVGDGGRTLLKTDITNADGRCGAPLLEGDAMQPASTSWCLPPATISPPRAWRCRSRASSTRSPSRSASPRADQNYHVPLVVTPWSYSTYRGS